MKKPYRFLIPLLMIGMLVFVAMPSGAAVSVQCPGDTDGDAAWNSPGEIQPADTKCLHLTGGDGFITMADGRPMYMFGFADVTGIPENQVLQKGLLAQTFAAPPIVLDEGDHFYLTLSNVGMVMRPDLFDPHTVHYHGFPESSNIFDGLPESGIAINMGSSLTYYYLNNEPGTYMYHCHVEATEHMQMGMLGSLYVRPAQNGKSIGGFTQFAYNDGDGSTGYDVEVAIQLGSFDSAFHDSSEGVQPLPFALMRDDYPMLNGRGYPDTVGPAPAAPPDAKPIAPATTTQPLSALVEANGGDRILLRLSNLAVTRFYTLTSLGIPMQVVGKDARLLRGPGANGKDLYYTTNSVTMGGGESYDVILDTTGVAAGTYFLYAADLNYLANGDEDFGGMMTEIRIAP
ncbi:multicopper oxidase domain-containing protein [Desulfococcus sp.]|uniref:multicopper oxidase domain-containing protein n=1 Tax=Desulfococcus sp. TaxID=2025834 RepID=UPI0035940A18